MNLMGLMVAMAVMSIGALSSAYFLIDPPMALSRLTAQAEADSIIEALRQASWRGQKVQLAKDANGKTVVTVDGTPMTVPSNCTVEQPLSASTASYVAVTCTGSDHGRDNRHEKYRSSKTVMIGGSPCESDLFPTPPVNRATGSPFICTIYYNGNPPPPTGSSITGHFDIDTYTGFATNGWHVHRWDAYYGNYSSVSGLFNLMQPGDATPCGPVPASTIPVCAPLGFPQAIPEVLEGNKPFYLLITNGTLSPMMMLRFKYTGWNVVTDKDGNKVYSAFTSPEITCTEDSSISGARPFDKCFVLSPTAPGASPLTAIPFINTTAAPPKATDLGNSAGIDYYRLDYLYVGFSRQNPHTNAGIIPTSTALVNSSNSTPGVCGEYRNGAFVIQAVSDIPATLYRISSGTPTPTGTPFSCTDKYGGRSSTLRSAPGANPSTVANISGDPYSINGVKYTSNGGSGLAVSNVLYEMSIFWHASDGYLNTMSPMYYPFDLSSVEPYKYY